MGFATPQTPSSFHMTAVLKGQQTGPAVNLAPTFNHAVELMSWRRGWSVSLRHKLLEGRHCSLFLICLSPQSPAQSRHTVKVWRRLRRKDRGLEEGGKKGAEERGNGFPHLFIPKYKVEKLTIEEPQLTFAESHWMHIYHLSYGSVNLNIHI